MTTALSQLQQLRTDLASKFPERREAIEGALAAVLAGEHVLLLGPPGTGKSALVRAIAHAVSGRYFKRLLPTFARSEELFSSGLTRPRAGPLPARHDRQAARGQV